MSLGARHRPLLLAAAVAAQLAPVATLAAQGEERRHWALPDHAKLQLAGNVGFVSPGIGYSWLGGRLEGDAFFGWVPPPLGGEHIVAATAKLTWAPWRVPTLIGWALRPLTLAAQLTYTFGHEYFVRLPERYPDDYYPLPSAIRAAVAFGSSAGAPRWGFEEVAVYYELVAMDLVLGLWAGNRQSVPITDVLSLALGARVTF